MCSALLIDVLLHIREKLKKWTQKSILFYAYYFQTASSFGGHWLNQKGLLALGCVINMMQLPGACLVISSSRGSSVSFPDSLFITPWNPSGSFVLIFWVKCVLESMDLVNLGFPLGKKKKISPLIFTWAAQVVTFHCDCVVALCARNSHLWEPQLLVNEGESCNRN